MTIEKSEMKILKDEMEIKIMELLKNFEIKTGLRVIEIHNIDNTVYDKVSTKLL